MVNGDKRDVAAQLLQQLLDGSITNDEFEVHFPHDETDPALSAIRWCVWSHYSDLRSHTLSGKDAPSATAKALLERCCLFLRSGLDFEWPPPQPTVFMAVLSILTFGWAARQREQIYASNGDYEVWPFLRERDYRTHV